MIQLDTHYEYGHDRDFDLARRSEDVKESIYQARKKMEQGADVARLYTMTIDGVPTLTLGGGK